MSKIDTAAYDAWIKEIEAELAAQQVQESGLAEAQMNAYDDDLKALVTAAQNVIASKHKKETVDKLAEALEKFMPWMEEEPSPVGRVDDKGRP